MRKVLDRRGTNCVMKDLLEELRKYEEIEVVTDNRASAEIGIPGLCRALGIELESRQENGVYRLILRRPN